jgi:low temperature requirement protein LtrA
MSASMLRSDDTAGQVTNVELFFDLVYVFAVTQLSHLLVHDTSVDGAMHALLLLAVVWQAWVYTTWVTNWLDPDRFPTRMMLVAVMLGSLVMSAALPKAFENRGLMLAGAYAAIQIGRSVFTVLALRGDRLQRNFQRILAWCVVSGAVMIAGTSAHGHARELVWAAAIGFDFLGGRVGFYTPALGRSSTEEWDIEGSHFAERCEAFVLIALGESIVSIGSALAALDRIGGVEVAAFAIAFAGSVGLWWVYFDRVAEHGARAIANAADPGRIGATAYHLVHPIIVAGIIVTAAGDQVLLAHPTAPGRLATAWLVLGGTALFLGGHGIFKVLVFHVAPVSRLVGVAVLAALFVAAPHVNALTLAAAALAVIVATAVADRVQHAPASAEFDGADGGA